MSTINNFIIDMSVMDNLQLPIKKIKQEPQYKINYNDNTKKYCTYRKLNIDPITLIALDENYPVFKVEKMWDPYTGQFTENDPFGHLSFDPISLTIYFWMNRYTHLLKDSTSTDNISTDDGLGAGEDFIINSKGKYPERYLWRLPIVDCYIEKTDNIKEESFLNSVPKLGPKLERHDIEILYELVKQCVKLHPNRLERIPDLVSMYDTYHIAINPEPDISNINEGNSIIESRNIANVRAAYKLAFEF